MISDTFKNFKVLGINKKMKIKLDCRHFPFLEFHQKNIFK